MISSTHSACSRSSRCLQDACTFHISLAWVARAHHSKRQILDVNNSHGLRQIPKLGICVSGGSDSMALAYLLKQLSAKTRDFEVQAFIVDHAIRANSDKEADTVKGYLERYRITTEVLHLDWSKQPLPQRSSNIEGFLRQQRYHIIRDAGLKHNISHMFTGHHQDDQVETMIQRLLRDDSINPLSFQGMPLVAPFPLSDEIIQSQISVDRLESLFGSSGRPPECIDLTEYSRPSTTSCLGMYVHRPLVNISKNDILCFCRQNGVQYVTDQTNHDPAFTLRNTIRYLLARHKIPKALNPSNLLIAQKEARLLLQRIKTEARGLLDKACISYKQGAIMLRRADLSLQSSPVHLRGYAYFLARLFEVMSSLKGNQIPEMLSEQDLHSLLTCLPGTKMTKFGVLVAAKSERSSDGTQLVFSKQPPRAVQQSGINNHAAVVVEACSAEQRSVVEQLFSTKWQMLHNNVWVRLSSPDLARLKALTIAPCDGAALRKLAGSSSIAPVSTPVIYLDSKVVAIPTLNIYLQGSQKWLDVQVKHSLSHRAHHFLTNSAKDKGCKVAAEASASVEHLFRSLLQSQC